MQSQSETVQPYALTPSRWLAQDGDTVVVYQGVTELTQVTLKTGEILRGRFGEFLHDEFIGRPFGSKVRELSVASRMYLMDNDLGRASCRYFRERALDGFTSSH